MTDALIQTDREDICRACVCTFAVGVTTSRVRWMLVRVHGVHTQSFSRLSILAIFRQVAGIEPVFRDVSFSGCGMRTAAPFWYYVCIVLNPPSSASHSSLSLCSLFKPSLFMSHSCIPFVLLKVVSVWGF